MSAAGLLKGHGGVGECEEFWGAGGWAWRRACKPASWGAHVLKSRQAVEGKRCSLPRPPSNHTRRPCCARCRVPPDSRLGQFITWLKDCPHGSLIIFDEVRLLPACCCAGRVLRRPVGGHRCHPFFSRHKCSPHPLPMHPSVKVQGCTGHIS